MSDHIVTGKSGEVLAATFLVEQGFTILERNWRHRRCEIDIIASMGGVLHVVEVKTRTSTMYGFPEEGINYKKIRQVKLAAAAWCYLHPGWRVLQFDVVAVMLGKKPEVLYLGDAF